MSANSKAKLGYQFLRNMQVVRVRDDMSRIERIKKLLEETPQWLTLGAVVAAVLEDIPRPTGKKQAEVAAHRELVITELEKRCYAAIKCLKGETQ